MKILIINGPNLNLLGEREPGVYGSNSYADLIAYIENTAAELGISAECFQSNHEGNIIDAIHAARLNMDGIVINPGALTHYSYAVHDALKSVNVPTVEVHISNIAAREEFRRVSVTAPACAAQISGMGFYGYAAAMRYLAQR